MVQNISTGDIKPYAVKISQTVQGTRPRETLCRKTADDDDSNGDPNINIY
jgi:hypothetical protein